MQNIVQRMQDVLRVILNQPQPCRTLQWMLPSPNPLDFKLPKRLSIPIKVRTPAAERGIITLFGEKDYATRD
jgi:hypothetical protein